MQFAPYSILNGALVDADNLSLTPTNRAFYFGDGLFETLRIVNGQPLFLSDHLARAAAGLRHLGLELPETARIARIKISIQQLLEKNHISKGARLRITFWRDAEGFYLPSGTEVGWLMQVIPMDQNEYAPRRDGLSVDIYNDLRKPIHPLSGYKFLGAHLFIKASLHAKAQNLGDVLLTNDKHHIIESSRSNLFISSNGVLYTPSLQDGCHAGIMRMQIINTALRNGIKVYECSLSPQHLLSADEMFTTNVVNGIEWVSSYKIKRYTHSFSDKLISLLNDHIFKAVGT